MKHEWLEEGDNLKVAYSWKKAGKWNSFMVNAQAKSQPVEAGGEIEFITEHYWGYTQYKANTTYEYEVTHPKWEAYPVTDHVISVDYGQVYGQEFAFLSNQQPTSVLLAEGSTITVEGKRRL